jgi:cation transport ATPase
MEGVAVTLVKGNRPGIVKARQLNENTARNIWQNLFFTFFYQPSRCAPPPGFFIGSWELLTLTIACTPMTFSSVSVISNALRLNRLGL